MISYSNRMFDKTKHLNSYSLEESRNAKFVISTLIKLVKNAHLCAILVTSDPTLGGYVRTKLWDISFQRPAAAAYTHKNLSASRKFQIPTSHGSPEPILCSMGYWAIWDPLNRVRWGQNWKFIIKVAYGEHFWFYEKKNFVCYFLDFLY